MKSSPAGDLFERFSTPDVRQLVRSSKSVDPEMGFGLVGMMGIVGTSFGLPKICPVLAYMPKV